MVSYEIDRAELRVYTKEVREPGCPPGLAHSIHFACGRAGEALTPLNLDYGILFATSKIKEDDTIRPLSLRDPGIFTLSGEKEGYGVAAFIREDEDRIALWTTADFMSFHEEGVFEKSAFEDRFTLDWQEAITIDAFWCDRLLSRWGQIKSVGVRVPERVEISSPAEIDRVRAQVVYSDESTDEKRVVWDWENRKEAGDGLFRVTGKVVREAYPYPLAVGFADPVVYFRNGRYYFLSTNDNVNDIGIYLREADDVAGLFQEDCKLHVILDKDEEKGFIQTFWAPEFHEIGGSLYILFAVSGQKWGPQCHIMKYKEGMPLTDKAAWECPRPVVRQDGSMLTQDGITLDMTYVKAGESSYAVWSYRRGIGTPADTGSMLYIAKVSESEPWRLTSEPVLLSRPLYGWENVNGTINNEGPHAFVSGGRVYLTYSGGDACGYTYAVGLLTADENDDLLKPESWEKSPYPVLHFLSVEGEYGPGHNSFFVSPENKLMIAYHAEDEITRRIRCTGMHRVHFDVQGRPVFDMDADRDLDPALAEVEIQVFLGGK